MCYRWNNKEHETSMNFQTVHDVTPLTTLRKYIDFPENVPHHLSWRVRINWLVTDITLMFFSSELFPIFPWMELISPTDSHRFEITIIIASLKSVLYIYLDYITLKRPIFGTGISNSRLVASKLLLILDLIGVISSLISYVGSQKSPWNVVDQRWSHEKFKFHT